MTISKTKHTIIALINACFRNIAEYDYISARVLFRNELYHQFLWSALQSLEKYTKAILLYNDISVKNIKHKPYEALEKAKSCLPGIQPLVDNSTEEFIQHIEDFGNSRYLEKTTVVLSDWLTELDKAVWYLRRFCFSMDFLHPENDPQGIDRYSQYIEYAQNSNHLDNPFQYHFFSSSPILTILKNRASNPRKYENLVWKNLYFGRRRKNVIWLRQFSRFQKPTHIIPRNISPQLLQWIDEHIYMPRNIVKYLTEISSMMESQE